MQPVTQRRLPAGPSPDRGELALLSAAMVSRLGDAAAAVAVVLLVLARTGDPRLAGLVVASFALPTLVTGPVLGAYLDRLRAKRVLFAGNQLLLVAALAAILLLAGRAPGAALVGLGLLAGLTAPVLTGGYSALVPLVVAPARLPRANAADAASYNLAGLAGPAAVAALAGAAGPGVALAAVAALAAGGLALVLAAPMPPAPPPPPAQGRAESLPAALADGARLLWRSPLLRATTSATTLSYAVQGLLPVGLPLFAAALGHPPSAGGWLLAAIGAGALLGALASTPLLRRAPPRTVLLVALAGFAGCLTALAAAPTLTLALPLAALAGLAEGPVLAATLTVRQQCVPAHRYAQVVASAASLKTGAYALGAAATGALATTRTPQQILLTVAAGQLLALVPLLPPRLQQAAERAHRP